MTTREQFNPLKIGLLIVTISYFLFAIHDLFTLEWIGEWSRFGGFSLELYVEDIVGTAGIVFRFLAGAFAVGAMIYYFSRGFPSEAKAWRVLRWILVFEAVYWLALSPNWVFAIRDLTRIHSWSFILNSLALTIIPSLVESIVLPIALFILAYKLKPGQHQGLAVKWGLIVGTIYLFVFWTLNSSIWIYTVRSAGTTYLITYPQHAVSFALTIFGLLALAIYTVYLAAKSSRKTFVLKWKTVGVIVTLLGLYFLWNYLSWIFFGSNTFWSDWYRWWLGHNLDLWMLSLPLVGVPLLFADKFWKRTDTD